MKVNVAKLAKRAGFVVNETGMIAVRRKNQLYYCTLEIETLVRALEAELAADNEEKLDNYDWLLKNADEALVGIVQEIAGLKEPNAHAAIYAARLKQAESKLLVKK
jgi:hypothetical protein